jgi:hypothetical protein
MESEQGDEVRWEGRRAIAVIEQNGSPFSDGWENWSPDPELSRPEMEVNWNDLSMYS